MLLLVLGKGKTGSLVAQIAREHGHSVRALDIYENREASSLTAPLLAQVDVVVDFTSPESAVENMRACLALGARIVVGTTGWYDHLNEMKALAIRRGGALLYGTNFSLGVQKMFSLTQELARLKGYEFSISETHHVTKLDAPSGTALTLKQIVEAEQPGAKVEVTSNRVGDHSGLHVVTAKGPSDVIELKHEAFDRRGFAEGAVRAAEWVCGKSGAWEFREIFDKL
ncbi:MAG TPA: dihydrodipicolinate reductase C-terminal domain-containing protein [Acidobacteriaceae bacterium]|jgi:4-hydroxy-tetrahydrodipicolinate reductase|nr:dihydrodipicolinate reductase C-terminal domain-containing protein [Acidobacteriaceae bacterium]